MDPTINLIYLYDSIKEESPPFVSIKGNVSNDSVSPIESRIEISSDSKLNIIDIDTYNLLYSLREELFKKGLDQFNIAKNLINPFQNIGENLVVQDKESIISRGKEFTSDKVSCKIGKKSSIVCTNDRNEKSSFVVESYCDSNNQTCSRGSDIYNPDLGKSKMFMNRDALKMANLDIMFGLTSFEGFYSFFQPISEGRIGLNISPNDEPGVSNEIDYVQSSNPKFLFKFCDIAGGPGGFTQYIKYRRFDAMGYGISLRNPNIANQTWHTDEFWSENFQVHYGFDDTGDILTNYADFIRIVMRYNPEGMDLVVASGKVPNSLYDIEERNFRLILTEAYMILSCVGYNRDGLLKVFDVYTERMIQLIYLLSVCFKSATLIKPITTNPADSEKYLVLQERREDIEWVKNILLSAIKNYLNVNNSIGITSIIPSESIDIDFINRLTEINNELINNEINTLANVLDKIGGNQIEIEQYNLQKCTLLWHLPDH